jgi:type IV pilus assembly protein PilW
MSQRTRTQLQRPRHQALARGFTLVELMVAIALGLAVLTVVAQGFASVASATRTNSAVAEAQTNGRHALEVLKREIRHAALHPLVWSKDQVSNVDATLQAKNYGCGLNFVTLLTEGVTGANDSNPYATSCLADASDRTYARGDVLVLRRTALEPTTTTNFDFGAPYVSTSYGQASLFIGAGTATVAPALPEPNLRYRLLSDVYYINSFTTSADEVPLVPALYRLRLSEGANPQMTPELVASNVELIQVQYAVPNDAGDLRYVNANTVTDWSIVKTARIWLLVRESLPEPGLSSGSYSVGDVTYTPNDHFRRTVLSTTVAVRNNV